MSFDFSCLTEYTLDCHIDCGEFLVVLEVSCEYSRREIEIFLKIKCVLLSKFNVVGEVLPESLLGADLGLDSLDQTDLMLMVDDLFGVDISDFVDKGVSCIDCVRILIRVMEKNEAL